MTINIYQAKAQFSKLIELVQAGEKVIISKNNKPVAMLEPIPSAGKKRTLGTAKGQISMTPDFNAPLDDFREYMEPA